MKICGICGFNRRFHDLGRRFAMSVRINTQPQKGARFCDMELVRQRIGSHHECFDGLGFPDGLSRLSIPCDLVTAVWPLPFKGYLLDDALIEQIAWFWAE